MNRSDLQRLTELRLNEARTLFAARAFEGAYYLAGYAVECALKACIAKQTREFDFPEKRVVERSYTHDLVQLLGVADVGSSSLQKEMAANPPLEVKWNVVKLWTEASRYAVDVSEATAHNMLVAISDDKFGVLPWLKKYW